MRGKLILFEGLDRSGKSTQSQKLHQSIEHSTLMRFPNRDSLTGKQIDQYLQGKQKLPDQAIHLLFSANRWELRDQIIELLNQGKDVIMDRYVYSGVAYSSAKGLDLNWCLSCDRGLPKPDLLFFIQIEQDQVKDRQGFGEELYETQTFQDKVRTQYELLKTKEWIVLNGNQSIEALHGQIKHIVNKYTFKSQEIQQI